MSAFGVSAKLIKLNSMIGISTIFSKIKRTPFALHQVKSFYLLQKPSLSCIDSYSSSKLLSDYFKSGRIKEAEKLFDEIPERNVVFWSIVIHGYAINGCGRKSVELFSQMRMSGWVPNSFTIVGVLVGIQGLQDWVLGQSVYGLVVKYGLESDSIVGTAVLDTYAKCGNMTDSYKLFKGLKNPCLASCNAMIAGFINSNLFDEAVMLFKELRKHSLVPNIATVLTITRGCVALDSRTLCEVIHGLIIKLGLDSHILVNNSVLDMYSCLLDLDSGTKIFEGMEHKDVISWTTMMGLLVNLECAADAVKLFCKMRPSGVGYDAIVIMNLTTACGLLGALGKGKQVHAQAAVSGFLSELPVVNSLIAMYSKCGELDSSRSVFDQSTQKSLVSWTAMISGHVQNGVPVEALNLLNKVMREENFDLDSIMLIGTLTASGELAAFELCQQLHCYAFEAGFSNYRSVQNSLISTYSKCGSMDLAYNVFNEMGLGKDMVSWNAIINGYGINGCGETALALYHEMKRCKEKVDSATYLCILNACSHAGLVEDGLMIFKEMVEDDNLRPDHENYGCFVDLIARAGFLSEASSGSLCTLLEEMGPYAWKALFNGCMLHSNVELAEFAARKIFEWDPGESGQVVLLSNIYASAGRFQEAEVLRSSMLRKGLMKNPGYSLLCRNPYDSG
ncbi:hypothetical protein SLE2022_199810 [Rubroshorea leprosula]